MKISRDFILLGSLVGVLATGTVLYWSNRQVEHLTAAEAEFTQARTTHRAALGESTARLVQLKAQLAEVQRSDRVPPTYDEWSRQQGEARAAIAALRQRIADLEPAITSPIPAQPGLIAASQKIRSLSTTLLADWREFEQRGSGLTQPSRDFAAAKLAPLLADELQPAFAELADAEFADADFKAAAFPRILAPVQRIRLGAAAGLLVALATLGYSLLAKRRGPPHLVVKAQEKVAASRPASLAAILEKDALPPPPGQLRVLVAEQNANDRDIVSLLLTNAGHAATGCDNGQAARAAIRDNPFALVLIDLHLPEDGGLEILREARRGHPRLPAILICNPGDDVPRFEANDQGATEVIRRPLNPRTLLWTVSEILFPGENRESRDYSPYVPDTDDIPPAEPPVAERVVEAPPPPQRLRPAEPPAPIIPSAVMATPKPPIVPPAPKPALATASAIDAPPTATPPRITFVSRTPRAVATPASVPPPVLPTASAPALPEPATTEPESTAPADLDSGAPADPASGLPTPGSPRKKMVRRKILPDE